MTPGACTDSHAFTPTTQVRRWSWVASAVIVCSVASSSESSPPADSNDPEVLLAAYAEARRDQDWPTAIEVARKLNSLSLSDAEGRYRLACAYALSGDRDLAIEWLAKSAAGGFDDEDKIRNDPDLRDVRDHPGYGDVQTKVHENSQRRYAKLARRFDRHPPPTLVPRGFAVRPTPVIIVLLGYGGDAKAMFDLWKAVVHRNRFAVVVLEGTHRLEGGGRSWDRPADAEFLVLHALAKFEEAGQVDAGKTVLAGFSQSADLALSIALRHQSVIGGAILHPGGHLLPEDIAVPTSENPPMRIRLVSHENDRVVTTSAGLIQVLNNAGFDTKLLTYSGLGLRFPSDPVVEFRKVMDNLR